jgi:hypothetical protein
MGLSCHVYFKIPTHGEGFMGLSRLSSLIDTCSQDNLTEKLWNKLNTNKLHRWCNG